MGSKRSQHGKQTRPKTWQLGCKSVVLIVLFFRLTAFVMRVLCKAQTFNGVNIDERLVCDSVDWLIQNQRADGALPEINAVISREMVVRNATSLLSFHNR